MLAHFVAFALLSNDDIEIHPCFKFTNESIEGVWARGFEDGTKRKNIDKQLGFIKRQIDSYHVSMVAKEGCSWAYFMHPKALIYSRAFTAGSQFWPQEEIEKEKKSLFQFAESELKFIAFYVDLWEMPSFAAPYGELSRYADASNLTDIRCVLRVGEKIIQPKEQPGDLTISTNSNVSFYSIPTTTFVDSRSRFTGSAYGSTGYVNATGYSATSYRVTTTSFGEQPYSTYQGKFIVLFPIRDENNKVIVSGSDKQLELIVIKKSRQLTAKYPLGEWVKALSK
jgi:hypothetical protein